MRELGLEVRMGQIGDVLACCAPARPGMAQPLMMGSHIDTVRNAGALDGCYGVLAGLAVVRAWQAGLRPARAIVVAAFTNEEGVRYRAGHDRLAACMPIAGAWMSRRRFRAWAPTEHAWVTSWPASATR